MSGDLKVEIMTVVLQQNEIEKQDESILKLILAVLYYQESNTGTELTVFPPETLQEQKVSMLTFVERTKLVTVGKTNLSKEAN